MRCALACVLVLTSCATTSNYPKARTTIERIELAYQRLRGPTELAIARLPDPAASRARAALVIADAAAAVVRSDADPLERAAAARDLVRAAAILSGFSSAGGARPASPAAR